MGRIPCTDYTCQEEHEILRTGPTMALYHLEDDDEREMREEYARLDALQDAYWREVSRQAAGALADHIERECYRVGIDPRTTEAGRRALEEDPW
jgi:hypothetical protein